MSHNIGDPSGACIRCGSPTKVYNYDEAPDGFRGNYSWECEKCGRFYQANELDDKGHTVYVFENEGKTPATFEDFHTNVEQANTALTAALGLPASVMQGVSGSERAVSFFKPELGTLIAPSVAHGDSISRSIGQHIRHRMAVEAELRRRTPIQQVPNDTDEPIAGSELLPQPVDCLYRTYQDISVERGSLTIIKNRAALRGVTVDAICLDDSMTFDEILVGDGKQVFIGIDLASEPSVSGIISAHFVQGVDGRPHLEIDEVSPMPVFDNAEYQLQDSVSEASVIQCICCVAGGDDSKKICELRTDTGIEEGWWCNECYLDWQNNGQP